jgi:TatD DNase family protein
MLIDAHSHLNIYLHKKYWSDINDIIDQINVNKIITLSNSLDFHSYKINQKISSMSEYVIPAFGIHPWKSHKYTHKEDEIIKQIESTNFIGEIGLDYFFVKKKEFYPAQRDVFSIFLDKTKDRVISVHTKGAEKDCYQLIKEYGNKRVIIHWYSGDLKNLKKMIDESYYFSIGPEINYSDHIKRITQLIPLDRILTETDNPGGPAWLTGEKGIPILIKDVVDGIARIKGVTSKSIENIVEENFSRISSGLI